MAVSGRLQTDDVGDALQKALVSPGVKQISSVAIDEERRLIEVFVSDSSDFVWCFWSELSDEVRERKANRQNQENRVRDNKDSGGQAKTNDVRLGETSEIVSELPKKRKKEEIIK
ncbi:unnamed protein product [Arabis nemorensis]|uniref:Uncharacterized protein n=1 Tax=Arabis nemorensis TaxID=586526 RepID=A0A565CF71_9BRAS|nr:unnamed protein product [Arabis nemorensis]